MQSNAQFWYNYNYTEDMPSCHLKREMKSHAKDQVMLLPLAHSAMGQEGLKSMPCCRGHKAGRSILQTGCQSITEYKRMHTFRHYAQFRDTCRRGPVMRHGQGQSQSCSITQIY